MLRRAIRGFRITALAAVAAVAGLASAQPSPRPGQQPAAPVQDAAIAPSWSSPALERIGTMLAGTWKTDSAVPVPGSTETVNIVFSIAPVGIEGMPNALYAEAARADALWDPYRQAIFQLFEYKGKIRLRTYEFHNANVDKDAFIGAWAAPEAFPPLSADKFIATLDLEGTETGGTFTARTPAAYPTAVGGAVEMTSEIELSANRLVTADRGFDAQGNIAWGQDATGRYVYSKVTPEATVTRHDDGLVVIEYRAGAGRASQAGDTAAFHYSGWFTRNAELFNSSKTQGMPYSYTLPGTMIAGWARGIDSMRPGSLRRIYIPFMLGYGEGGQPPRMPGRSNLMFEIECMNVAEAPAAPTPPVRPAPQNQTQDTPSGG